MRYKDKKQMSVWDMNNDVADSLFLKIETHVYVALHLLIVFVFSLRLVSSL